MPKPRIVHCAYSGLGGHAAVLFTLLNAQMLEEFDNHVIFFGVEDLCEDYALNCNKLGIPFTYIRKLGKLSVQSHREILRAIDVMDPRVVMVHGTPLAVPILIARALRRSRWSVVVRESTANHQKTLLEWLGSYAAATAADAVVYLTKDYKAEVEKRLRMLLRRSGAAEVIPNGIDLSEFRLPSPSSGGRLRLAMIGRLVPLKNHTALINAVRILCRKRGKSDLELVIAGDGPLRAELEAKAAAAGLDAVITFVGLLGRAEIIDLLQTTDIYVHCTYGEGMSNSILQAMAARLPVVASDVPGVSNVLRHQVDGVLVPVDDPAALAGALERLLDSGELRIQLGEAARMRIEAELSQQRVVESYLSLFRSLLSSDVPTAVS
jgi:glycosyltransferase involved in cell wall biosynthesis